MLLHIDKTMENRVIFPQIIIEFCYFPLYPWYKWKVKRHQCNLCIFLWWPTLSNKISTLFSNSFIPDQVCSFVILWSYDSDYTEIWSDNSLKNLRFVSLHTAESILCCITSWSAIMIMLPLLCNFVEAHAWEFRKACA